MNRQNKIVATAVALSLGASMLVSGCATVPEDQKGKAEGGAIGAAAGAVLGGIIGSQSGSTGKGMVLGALIGGLSGALIGDYYYDQKKTPLQTTQTYGYTPSQGTLVRLEQTKVTPSVAKPGDRVNIESTYAVLDSRSSATIPVREVREIRSKTGELIGRPEVQVNREGGTYSSSVPIVLPSNAKKGVYVVTTSVEAGNAKDTRETTFEVR